MQEKPPWDARLITRIQRGGRQWEKPVRRAEVLLGVAVTVALGALSIVLSTVLWYGFVGVLFYFGQLRARWSRTRRRGTSP